jgi:two-component system, NtrC family, sensor histidine kinase KinB
MSSLRHKLWLGFGTLLLVLVLVSTLSLIVLTFYSHVLQRLFRENYDSVLYCDAMKASVDELNSRAQQLIWQEQAARQIDAAAQQRVFSANLRAELGNITLPGEGHLAEWVADLWDQYQAHYQQFDAAAPADRPALYRDDLLPRYQSIKSVAQKIADLNMSNMVSVDGQVKRTLTEVRNVLLALAIGGILIAFAVVSAAGTTILRPLNALTGSVRQIEAGNLDLHVPVQTRDELGQLAEAFNAMSSKLREFRRLDHDRLVRTQQTTQLAIDSLPDAVFVIGPGGAVEISNRTAAAHFGVTPGATVSGLSLRWLTPLYEQVCRTRRAAEPNGYRSALQLFDESHERFLLPRAVPMLDSAGGMIGVTVTLVDVTRLHAADEAKSNLVSTVSHELRTPLTAIRMALGLLARESFAPKTAGLMKAAREESDRLYRIVENLLSISRIESGRAQFQLRPMSPTEIIAQAVDPMRAALADKNIRLEVECAGGLPKVLADPAAIGSALTNLLSNALKFTPSGGQVRVAAAALGESVVFTVADTGPGIPDQYAQRVFDKFFRVPGKDGPSGAGLGLAIAKEVVEAHGGVIELCTGDGSRSTFRFTLPAQANPG